MNIVKLKNLEKVDILGQKSPLIIFDNGTKINSAICLEELSELLKENTIKPRGNSIYLESASDNIEYSCWPSTFNWPMITTNIIEFEKGEILNTYDYFMESANLNFAQYSPLSRSCYISTESDNILSCYITNGILSKFNPTQCPSLSTIDFRSNGLINTDIVNVSTLHFFSSFNITNDNNNFIKYFLGYNKWFNKFFVLINLKNAYVYNNPTDNVRDILNDSIIFTNLNKFYFTGYMNNNFSKAELDLAKSKNIELINVR